MEQLPQDVCLAGAVLYRCLQYHFSRDYLKMPQRFFNRSLLLQRAFRHPIVLRLRLVIALAFYDSMLRFHLGNVQAGDLQAGMFEDIRLDFLIRCLGLCSGHIQLRHIQINVDMWGRPVFGQ